MEERMEYRLYMMQGDLEKLKYDYEMEYRKIDWMNRRAKMKLSQVKTSGQVIATAILSIMAIDWVFIEKNTMLYSFQPMLKAAGEVVAYLSLLAEGMISLFVVVPFLFALIKDFVKYLKIGNGYASHLYSIVWGKDFQQERKEAEENVYAMSNRIIRLEMEIEQLAQQVMEQQPSVTEQKNEMFANHIDALDANNHAFANYADVLDADNHAFANYADNRAFANHADNHVFTNYTDTIGVGTHINYEEADMKNKSSAEIQSHLYYLEGIERNLQKQYDREYSITKTPENDNTEQGNNIRTAVMMFCCGLGGALISSAVKLINISTIQNTALMYGAQIFGASCVLLLVLPAAFIIAKKLIWYYINSEKFIGKKYVDKMKDISRTTEQVESEKALMEISKKLAHIQAEKEKLKEVLRERAEAGAL